MNRRQFIYFLGAGLTAITVASSLFPNVWGTFKRRSAGCRCSGEPPLCNHCKEVIIAKALETPEGRRALANAMLGAMHP